MTNGKKLTPEELMQFNRELAAFVRAGVSLPEGLEKLAREIPRGSLKTAVEAVKMEMNRGVTLSEAVQSQVDLFGEYYASLVAGGEASGSMEDVLLQAARMSRCRIRFRRSLLIASTYPVILGLVCLLVTILVMFLILPRMQDLYTRFDAELPGMAFPLVKLQQLILRQPWIPMVAIIALAALYWWLDKTKQGRRFTQHACSVLPLTKRLIVFHLIEQFSRSLGLLLKSRVPIDKALTLTRGNMESPFLDPVLEDMQRAVTNGKPLSSVLEESSPFPPTMNWMLGLSEERGDLDETLLELADFYEEKRDFAYHQFVALAQPILLLVVGLVTGFLIASYYLPLFQLGGLLV